MEMTIKPFGEIMYGTWPASGRKEKKTVMQSINTVESFHIFRRAENGSTWDSKKKTR
jgi:hypothetical protein